MKSKGVAVVVAFLLAATATIAIYVYVQGVRSNSTNRATDMVTVIVPKQDIAAQTNLDSVVSGGGFTTLQVPSDALVQGAVTDITQLKGRTTRYPILAGEQITVARLQGSSQELKGGPLGIPAGDQALTLPFDAPEAVGGVLQSGDHVTIYASFDDITLLTGNLKKLVAGKGETKKVDLGDMTVTVVPDVQVLKVDQPATGTAVGTPSSSSGLRITFAVSPTDAQNVIEANAQGAVWLAMLPPNEEGVAQTPSSIANILVQTGRRPV